MCNYVYQLTVVVVAAEVDRSTPERGGSGGGLNESLFFSYII